MIENGEKRSCFNCKYASGEGEEFGCQHPDTTLMINAPLSPEAYLEYSNAGWNEDVALAWAKECPGYEAKKKP